MQFANESRSVSYNWTICTLIASGGIFFGYYISVFNPMGTPLLKNVYHLNKEDKASALGNLNLLFSFGALVMVIFSGSISSRVGRTRSLLLAEILALLTLALYNIESLSCLYLARFISGFIAGLNTSIAQITLKELFPAGFRAAGGMIIYVSVGLGVTASFSLRLFLSEEFISSYWKLLLSVYLPVSLARLSLFLYGLRFETPHFYLEKSNQNEFSLQKEKAKLAVMKIYSKEKVNSVLHDIEIVTKEKTKSGSVTFSELFSLNYRSRLIAGMLVSVGAQLTGINFIVFFSDDIFDEVSSNGALLTFKVGLCKLAAGFLGLVFVKKFGNKTLLTVPVFFQGIFFLLVYILIKKEMFSWVFLSVCGYMVSFAFGMGPVTLIYIADVLPPVGVGLALAVQWILTGAVGKIVPLIDQQFGADPLS